jgi:hypothetical protein
MAEVDVYSPESGIRNDRKTARLFLRKVLRQAMEHQAVALRLLYDEKQDCLRAFEYAKVVPEAEAAWIEFLPAPGCFAKDVLTELERVAGVGRRGRAGVLAYVYGNLQRSGVIEWPGMLEARIYLSKERPPVEGRSNSSAGKRGSGG